jgi:prepilin-type N-terminal cleavage/methylation domain-containing protein
MSRGFSLIELVIVIVVLTIAAVGIGSGFAYMSRSLSLNEDMQRSSQLALECAEHVLGQMRGPGGSYASVAAASPSTVCDGLPALPAGYSRTVDVIDLGAGGSALCTAGWSCKRVQITVTRAALSTALNFMLVNY